jgi:D-alanyl-lipoteichoic acid acyltransferase DltB (MBOAT superfamily)
MKKSLLIVLVMIFSFVGSSGPQKEDTYAMFKAMYIYNFTKNFDWPEQYKSGPFIIGVLGESNIYEQLSSKYATKSVGIQQIQVINFKKPEDIEFCHILFVTEDQSNNIPPSLTKNNTGTLVVTEKQGLLKQGVVVNFVIVNSKLEFELSKTNASRYNLSVGNQLQNLAMSVE